MRQDIRKVGTPYLERYYEIQNSLMGVNFKINYRHVFSTFTLSSREIFNCLDTVDRVYNFKTPIRYPNNESELESSQVDTDQGTPVINRKKSVSAGKKRDLKRKFSDDIKFDFWKNEIAFCSFCKKKLVSDTIFRGKHKSHLIYECQKVPNSSPVPKNINNRERRKAVFERLAEIAAAYDPGGQ